jgi:TnpA family transposase
LKVETNYVDSHGQSEVAFAFCHLLGFELMPRIKGIHRQKQIAPLALSKVSRGEMSNSYESNAGKEVLIPITFRIGITKTSVMTL